MYADVVAVGVMCQDIVFRDALLPYRHHLELQAVKHETLVPVLAENHFLAVAEDYGPVLPVRAVSNLGMRPVVENHAVGKHLHHGCAVVDGCRHHNLLIELELRIQSAGEECTFGSQDKASGIERMLHSTVRGCLGDCPELRGRRILPLCKTVDAVVEKDYIYVYVSPDGMYEMVSPYGKGIAVSAGLPYGQFGIGHFYPGGDCRCAPVDAVESVCVHIIRQSGGTAYPRHHHIALFLVAENFADTGHGPLQGCKHGMVPASGTPPHLLVTLEIFECIFFHFEKSFESFHVFS